MAAAPGGATRVPAYGGRVILQVPNGRLFLATILHPGSILLGAMAVAVLAFYAAGVEVEGQEPALSGVLAFAGIMLVAAWGLLTQRYWAVLGFQALLAITIVVAALSLLVRAGRLVGARSRGGRVLVQTFVPHHELLQAVAFADLIAAEAKAIGHLPPDMDANFAARLAQIHERGFQLDAGESHPEVWCLAAPVVRAGCAQEALTVIFTAAYWAQHGDALTATTLALARAAGEAPPPADRTPVLTREAMTAAAVRAFGLPE